MNLQILVRPQKDEPPRLAKLFYSVRIAEDAPIGSFVAQIIGIDRDSFLPLHFEIVDANDTASAFFSVDPKTGVVRTQQALHLPANLSLNTTDMGMITGTEGEGRGERMLDLRVRVRKPPPSMRFAVAQLSIEACFKRFKF